MIAVTCTQPCPRSIFFAAAPRHPNHPGSSRPRPAAHASLVCATAEKAPSNELGDPIFRPGAGDAGGGGALGPASAPAARSGPPPLGGGHTPLKRRQVDSRRPGGRSGQCPVPARAYRTWCASPPMPRLRAAHTAVCAARDPGEGVPLTVPRRGEGRRSRPASHLPHVPGTLAQGASLRVRCERRLSTRGHRRAARMRVPPRAPNVPGWTGGMLGPPVKSAAPSTV